MTVLPASDTRCAPAGIATAGRRADGDDPPVADEDRGVVDRRAIGAVDHARAGEGDGRRRLLRGRRDGARARAAHTAARRIAFMATL